MPWELLRVMLSFSPSGSCWTQNAGARFFSEGRGTGLKGCIWESSSFAALGTLRQKLVKNHTTRVLENIGLLERLFQREFYKTKYLQARRGLPKLDPI